MLLRKLKPEKWGAASQYFGSIGGLALAIGLILGRFSDHVVSDFMQGLLLGLSLVANVMSLILFGRFKRYRSEAQSQMISETKI